MRKMQVKNYITGRWVLTIKRDKDGKFLKCKARWVLRGFQDSQHWDLQTDSPTSTRPGFRLLCQHSANKNWDCGHIDLKTAFLQGDMFDKHRDVICQLPKEAGYPPHMAARLKRAAYGLNDAPRLWWNRLDKALCSYGLVPTRADRCCYVLYSNTAPSLRKTVKFTDCQTNDLQALEANTCPGRACPAIREASAFSNTSRAKTFNETFNAFSSTSTKKTKTLQPSYDFDLNAALDYLLDPISGSQARGKTVEGVLTIHVDDAFFAGTSVFHKNVIESLRRDFKVGSEDLNDILFVGQRVRWMDRTDPKKRHIRVDQETKVEELGEINFDTSSRDDITCSPDLHFTI